MTQEETESTSNSEGGDYLSKKDELTNEGDRDTSSVNGDSKLNTQDSKQASLVKNKKAKNPQNKRGKSTKKTWTIKVTIITFFLSAFFSFFSQITATRAGLVISSILLIFLLLISILFDAVGVCVTSCDIAPLHALASKKVPASKIAVRLVKNAEKVANICNDVVGDVCGIISGACTIAIVLKIMELASLKGDLELIISIILSSVVAAVTVGGKAYFKDVAMNNSKDLVMLTARVLNIFIKEK